MGDAIRSVPAYKWLFGFALILIISALPHAITVYKHDLPMALLNLHLTAFIVVFLHAEQRRQWARRVKAQRDLVELVAAADNR